MGDSGSLPDINVSNGTCYYTEHMQTKGNFIPCGNIAFGHWPCCQAGNMCLSLGNANACWDADTGNTYLAGCTDDGFNSRVCPWKSLLFHDQEWVAIQQCRPGTGNEDTVWGGCKVDANQTTLEKLPHASCDPYCTSSVMVGASVLPAFASLPSTAGGAIKWTSGFNPSSTSGGVKPTGATATTTPSSFITTPPTATPTSSSDNSGLTVGAKAGIGAGAGVAALLIVAVALLAFLMRRRKQRKNATAGQNNVEGSSSHPNHHHPPPHQYEEPPEQQQMAYYGNKMSPPLPTTRPLLSSQDSEPYVGYKAELSAEEAQGQPGELHNAYTSELAADETTMPRNEIGSSGGYFEDVVGAGNGLKGEGGSSSGGAHVSGVGGGGAGLSPHASPHPSSAVTAQSPFSTYSDVSTLYSSSAGGGGTSLWAPPAPPAPSSQKQ